MGINHKKVHLLSLAALILGFILSILIRADQNGIGGTGKMLALFALIVCACSFLMGGKLIPLITSCGYFITFLFAFFFQRNGVDPGGGTTNNFGKLWIISFAIVFVLSLYLESVYANKKLHS